MPVNFASYQSIIQQLKPKNITLVAVSKTKPVEEILELYNAGQRDFGENYVQEFVDKQAMLPAGIRWHFIGHLQSNKVRSIAPFVYLIHGVDSFKLLKEINKQGEKNDRVINCLLQLHIAQEETKFGLDEKELKEILDSSADLKNTAVCGMMGMASFTGDMQKIRSEFSYLRSVFDKYFLSFKLQPPTSNLQLPSLSMGMSNDYTIAMEEGSTIVRIGSLLFGERNQG